MRKRCEKARKEEIRLDEGAFTARCHHCHLAGHRRAGVVSATVLPTPVTIVLTFKELILSGELFGHLQISIYRAALGFCLARGLD